MYWFLSTLQVSVTAASHSHPEISAKFPPICYRFQSLSIIWHHTTAHPPADSLLPTSNIFRCFYQFIKYLQTTNHHQILVHPLQIWTFIGYMTPYLFLKPYCCPYSVHLRHPLPPNNRSSAISFNQFQFINAIFSPVHLRSCRSC